MYGELNEDYWEPQYNYPEDYDYIDTDEEYEQGGLMSEKSCKYPENCRY